MVSNNPVTEAVRSVREALDGGAPYAPQPRLSDAAPPPGTALVLRTSGSTGNPREVALSAAALRASAEATHERLGGFGHWLLVVPPTHIAGVQVITRSLATGRGVYERTPARFTPDDFAMLADDFHDGHLHGDVRTYVSIVPTQLHRLVAAGEVGEHAGLTALARFDAVLVGGAPTSPDLVAAAQAAGVHVVRTYGMSETSGGCVYDGVPLPGVRVRIAGPQDAGETRGEAARVAGDAACRGTSSGTGVVELSGPMLAEGYVGDPEATAAAFRTDPDGTRWFRTSDLGRLDGGRLTVLGRADDVILTGGVNVAPVAVEDAIGRHLAALGLRGEVCVVGMPDPEWGQAVVAVVVLGHGPADGTLSDAEDLLAELRPAVGAELGAPSAPRRVYRAGSLPTRGPGKVDRRAVRDAVARAEDRDAREPVGP